MGTTIRTTAAGPAPVSVAEMPGGERRPGVPRTASWLVVLGLFVAGQRMLFPAPLGVLVQGVVLGGLTALIAFGIALVHRADRIVNFAQGDLGGLPASLAVLLILVPGVPYLVAVPLGLLAAAALGWLVHGIVIRRFSRAPRLILTVATIFLAQVLAAGEVVLPRAFGVSGVPPQAFPSPFRFSFAIGQVVFSGNEVVAMAAVPLVLVALAAFLRRSALGAAVRACAENAERAALLGVPVERVRAAVWMLATVLSALSIFLRAGVVGLPVGRVLGPTILLRALAGAVIGRMERLPVILVACLGLGMLESAVIWHTGRAELVPPVLFAVLLAALLGQGALPGRRGAGAGGSDSDTVRSSWPAVRAVRPLPRALARLPEVRLGRACAVGLPAAVLVFLPLVVPESRLNLLARVAILAIVGVSLVVLTGWAGQVSLGQMAFVGIGAAVGGAATSRLGWDLSLALLAAGAAGALAATLIGIPALRIPGLFFAVTTLALAMATSTWLLNPEFMGWLPHGRLARPPLLGRIGIASETRYYYVALAGLGLALCAARNLRRARTGRALIGTRDNERAAAAFGVNPTRVKLTAFAVSGFLAAFAGALSVHHQQGLLFTPYAPEESLRVFAMVVIGGLGSLPGAVLGAAYVQGLDSFRGAFPEWLRPFVALLGTGLGGLVVLTVLPGGLGGVLSGWRDRGLRAVARRRGLA